MVQELDSVARYAAALGFSVRPRTILVEGTTDVNLLELAASVERDATGIELLGKELIFVAAGVRDQGGAQGVVRELVAFRGIARTCLSAEGRPRYRFVGLLDNDDAGRRAVNLAKSVDKSILEYKDIFRLQPILPSPGNLDSGTIQRAFEQANLKCKGLDWELEDLFPKSFVDAFLEDQPRAVTRSVEIGEKIHREFSRDGKACFHRFVKDNAVRDDLLVVIGFLKSMRQFLGLSSSTVLEK